MKGLGSCCDFNDRRNAELVKAVRYQYSRVKKINIREAFAAAVNMQTSRFWVSSERAYIVMLSIYRGLRVGIELDDERSILNGMRQMKREMFTEIFHRVDEIYKKKPWLGLKNIVIDVIYQPAPKFYLEPEAAIVYYSRVMNKKRKARR